MSAAPLVIGHRGASADAPENTLSAFAEAWRQGADGVELDLRLSADGRLVALHDEDFARTCGVPGLLRETPSERLRGLDAGARWPGRPPEPPPTLQDVLAIRPAGGRLVLELKEGPEALPELVRALRDAPPPVDLIAFRLDLLAEVRRHLPERPAWWLLAGAEPLPAAALEARLRAAVGLGLAGLDAEHRLVDGVFAAAARSLDLAWMAWTVGDGATARRLAALGAAALTVDRPAEARRWLDGREAGDGSIA